MSSYPKYPAALKVKIKGAVSPDSIATTLTKAMRDAAAETGHDIYWRNATIYINSCDEEGETLTIDPIFYTFGSEGVVTHILPDDSQPEPIKAGILLREPLREAHAALDPAKERIVFIWVEMMDWMVQKLGGMSGIADRLMPYSMAAWEANPTLKKSGPQRGEPHEPPSVEGGKGSRRTEELVMSWCKNKIHLHLCPTKAVDVLNGLTERHNFLHRSGRALTPESMAEAIQTMLIAHVSSVHRYLPQEEAFLAHMSATIKPFWEHEFPGIHADSPDAAEYQKWAQRLSTAWGDYLSAHRVYQSAFAAYQEAQKNLFMDHGFRLPGIKGIIKGIT